MPMVRKGAAACYVFLFLCIVASLYYPSYHIAHKSVHYDPMNAKKGFGTLYQRISTEKEMGFLITGDWGMTSRMQGLVAKQMEISAEKVRSQFVLSNGDNIYSWGSGSVHDPRFKQIFDQTFSLNKKFDQMPWYMSLGNHDRRGNIDSQIAYSQYNKRWVLPSRYYSFYLPIFEHLDLPPVQIIVLDTLPLVCSDIEVEMTFQARQRVECESFLYSERVRELAKENNGQTSEKIFHQIHQEISEERREQLKWLDMTLEENKSGGWKIIMGHHAMESASLVHGPRPMMNSDVRPILNRHGVDLYMCGHDHNLQHIKKVNEKMHHLVVGGGGFVTSSTSLHPTFNPNEYPGIQFAVSTFGFVSAILRPSSLQLDFIDYYGNSIYNTTIQKS